MLSACCPCVQIAYSCTNLVMRQVLLVRETAICAVEAHVALRGMPAAVCQFVMLHGELDLPIFQLCICPSLQVAAIHLHPEPFSLENGLMTPTFKVKRPQSKTKFQKQLDAMYSKLEK